MGLVHGRVLKSSVGGGAVFIHKGDMPGLAIGTGAHFALAVVVVAVVA